jgi:hypothetical protein
VKRDQLEHVVRAAADLVSDEIVVIGSQAAVGQSDGLPETMTVSMEADVFPLTDPTRAIDIDVMLGDGSSFHDQYGYYAHGVGPETPHAPADWEARAVRVSLPARGGWKREAVGHYMEIHDVVLSKLVAGRPKDFAFADAGIRSGLVDVADLRRGLELMNDADRPVATTNLEIVLARLQ